MGFPLIDHRYVYAVRAHDFLQLPPPNRSGFKTLVVTPYDEESCLIAIDLDCERTIKQDITQMRIKIEDSLKIATYILTQPLVDIVRASVEQTEKEKKEKDHEQTQH